jgi:hypothetical protein
VSGRTTIFFVVYNSQHLHCGAGPKTRQKLILIPKKDKGKLLEYLSPGVIEQFESFFAGYSPAGAGAVADDSDALQIDQKTAKELAPGETSELFLTVDKDMGPLNITIRASGCVGVTVLLVGVGENAASEKVGEYKQQSEWPLEVQCTPGSASVMVVIENSQSQDSESVSCECTLVDEAGKNAHK